MTKVFFSYSHADEDLRNRMEVHLAALKRQGLIETWYDRRITVGSDFKNEIDEQLFSSDIILLLVSPDFIDSDYCYDVEFQAALKKRQDGSATIVPIILHHCDWKTTPLGDLLAVPTDGKPISSWPDMNEAFVSVVNAIRDVLPKEEKKDQPSAQAQSTTISVVGGAPRSSNLRVAKKFSEEDKHTFTIEAFAFMSRFFESSMEELGKRNSEISSSFRQIDANTFTAILFRDGEQISRCKIWLHDAFGETSIAYSEASAFSSENSYNATLVSQADEQGIYLTKSMFDGLSSGQEQLTFEGAAEYYWSKLMDKLQI